MKRKSIEVESITVRAAVEELSGFLQITIVLSTANEQFEVEKTQILLQGDYNENRHWQSDWFEADF